MPTFYNYTENGVAYSFDDVFVPADSFREGNLFTWGNESFGGLGNNLSTGSSKKTPLTTFAGGANWKQVGGGGFSGCSVAIKTDGTLWTWSANGQGQLGDNTVTNKLTPVTTFIGGTNWKQVSPGAFHCAAIKTDGTLWTWGYGTSGQLGNNTVTNKSTPVTTFAGGTNWKQVAAGYKHCAAIKTDGTLWTWGDNSQGQLGDNTVTTKSTPVTTFAGGTNWKQVAAGYKHCAAIKTDGTLWNWGINAQGQLGIDNTTTRSTPVTTFVGGTNWKQVGSHCVSYHTAAIKTDGTLWTWGFNNEGQLGNNTATNKSTPVTTFAGGTNWKKASCGGNGCGAIKTDGTLWTWGACNFGQLGDDTVNVPKYTPVTTFAGGNNWKQTEGAYSSRMAIKYIDSVL